MTYQAQARIACRIFGSVNDVTIGKRTGPTKSHPSFNALSITQRLFAVPPAAVDTVPDNDRTACLAKATAYIKSELPAAYALDANGALPIPGHAWIDGAWVPTNEAHVSYAFPLTRNSERIEDECMFEDPSGKQQAIMLSWWVVVQPR
jgi:hypothetical protein